MVYKGKYKIIDNLITACDYEFVLLKVKKSIFKKKSLLISPIASHTLVRAHYDNKLKKILGRFDYLVPDSQWVRWSILFLYGKNKDLSDRVYGPELMLRTCNLSQNQSHKVFLYGNTFLVLKKLKQNLKVRFPKLKIVGSEESKFRDLTKKEWGNLIKKIEQSKTNIIFISLGSPRQEIFSYMLSKQSKNSLIVLPVGAAFDFISGNKPQAPIFIQNSGFEWLFRLINEPRRLIARYFIYNYLFLYLIIKQKLIKKIKLM